MPGSLNAAENPPSAALCCCQSHRNSDTDSDRNGKQNKNTNVTRAAVNMLSMIIIAKTLQRHFSLSDNPVMDAEVTVNVRILTKRAQSTF